MASSDSSLKSSLHIRSNSLPSAPHPLVSQFEEHLSRLKSSESASSSSLLHLKATTQWLTGLHDCIDKVLQLPTTQQDFAREFSSKTFDELLDGSARLLDVCSIAKDFLLQSKESLQELQSVIRRRRGSKNGLAIAVGEYLASRKKMKKAICKGHLKQNRWSAISKLMQPKRVSCDSQEIGTNELEKVDEALKSLVSQNNLQGDLENLEMCIQDLERGVECLSRKLIRTRVSLLNIFNN
ncbi:uncharacterized protein LOC114712484 [Neltuma alba]|uniref:uncharacterized protein LOC114712484 n=1 Tax=Neltuma alba TaxID=207710 RepID=UPI0010A45DC1|nr:uncharacterized protein LOC114712484 [Prosopis alba]